MAAQETSAVQSCICMANEIPEHPLVNKKPERELYFIPTDPLMYALEHLWDQMQGFLGRSGLMRPNWTMHILSLFQVCFTKLEFLSQIQKMTFSSQSMTSTLKRNGSPRR